MMILRDIANSLDRNLTFAMDFPFANPSGAMPVLDMVVWVDQGVLRYGVYKKPYASLQTIMERLALGAKTERSTCLQEGIRRLRAIGSLTIPEERYEVMVTCMDSLRISE